MPNLAIHWFRQDLRLGDNPALTEAARHGAVLPVYVLDDVSAGPHAMGGASRWWLHRSLERLNASLGGRLHVVTGNARECLPALAEQVGARLVTWNRCYEPWRVTRDSLLKRELHERVRERVHGRAAAGQGGDRDWVSLFLLDTRNL